MAFQIPLNTAPPCRASTVTMNSIGITTSTTTFNIDCFCRCRRRYCHRCIRSCYLHHCKIWPFNLSIAMSMVFGAFVVTNFRYYDNLRFAIFKKLFDEIQLVQVKVNTQLEFYVENNGH